MMYVGHASGQQVALKHWYSQTYIFTPFPLQAKL